MHPDKPLADYIEMVSSIVQNAIADIVVFHKYSEPSIIKEYLSTSKKSPTCSNGPYEQWHPSNIRYAYEFLFKDEEIQRYDYEENSQSYSLRSLLDSMNVPDIGFFRKQIWKKLYECMGCFPRPALSISLNVTNGVQNDKAIEKEMMAYLVHLTYIEEIEWHSCAYNPRININGKMRWKGAFEANYDEHKYILVSYEKFSNEVILPRTYREYLLIVDGKLFKSAGKLWRVVNTPRDRKSLFTCHDIYKEVE